MKISKYFLVIVMFILCAFLVTGYTMLTREVQKEFASDVSDLEVLGTISGSGEVSFDYNARQIQINWFEVDPSKIVLIPNFSEKEIASVLVEKNNCVQAVNAGFYTKQNTPVGFFVHEYRELEPFRTNAIMNGVLSINQLDTPRITRLPTSDTPRIAIQTGPILIENDTFLTPRIEQDKFARRIIAFTTGENRLYFAAIFTANAVFNGPEIKDLPELLKKFEVEAKFNIADAINLDGGSASYFKSTTKSLNELSPIGALLCEK